MEICHIAKLVNIMCNKSNEKNEYPFRDPWDAWRMTKDGIELNYPILHYDKTIPIIKATIQEVIGDIDFWGWKGSAEDRIVDSTGKVFFAKYEEIEGKTLLLIPVTRGSGVFPGELERIMDISEVKSIMISAIERTEGQIKEDINELKLEINSMKSIEGILKICCKYF